MNEYKEKTKEIENRLLKVSRKILESKSDKYTFIYKLMRDITNFSLTDEEIKEKLKENGFSTSNKREIYYIKNMAMFDSYIVGVEKGLSVIGGDFNSSFCENIEDYGYAMLNFKKALKYRFQSVWDIIKMGEWFFYQKHFKPLETEEYFYKGEQIPLFSKMFDDEIIEITDVKNIAYNLKLITVEKCGDFIITEPEHNFILCFYQKGFYWVCGELLYLGEKEYVRNENDPLNFVYHMKERNKHLPAVFWEGIIETGIRRLYV